VSADVRDAANVGLTVTSLFLQGFSNGGPSGVIYGYI
jgi:hypothetical protein